MKFPSPLPPHWLSPPAHLRLALSFRVARLEDLDTLYQISDEIHSRRAFATTFQRTLHEQQTGRTLLLLVEMADVGVIGSGRLVRYTDARAEIANLGVLPAWRNVGVGTALIQVLTRIARAAGVARLEIGASERNTRALALYRRLGFEPVRAFCLPDGSQACLLEQILIET